MKLLLENWRKYIKEDEAHPSEYISFKSGDCSLLAIAVADSLNLPTYGVFDEEDRMHHVFAYDPDADEAIDCRGRMPVKNITQNIRGNNLTYREVTRQQLEDTFGTYSDEEYEYAEETAQELI